MTNYTGLAAEVSQHTSTIEIGIGQKYGQVIHAYAMTLSGIILAFIKGWSLTLPILMIGPIMIIGLSCLIKGAIGKAMK